MSKAPAYVVRFDYPRGRGWQVRLPTWHPLSRDGQYSEFFPEGRLGGERKAYRAAKTRRDELMAGLPLPVGARPAANVSHARSSSGLVGIKLAFRDGRAGESAFSWKAFWQDKGVTRRRSFAVSVYGFAGALRRAISEREKHTGLKFSAEQRAAALDMHKLVDRYCRTGEAPIFTPRQKQIRARRLAAPVGA